MTDVSKREAQRERAARNQSLFREVNERINELTDSTLPSSFICECTNEGCDESIPLTLTEYEEIRANGNRFVVLAGHEVSTVEEIVARGNGYIVVAKLGAGAPLAEQLDPRQRAGAK
jgi:hypothetical protein